jgi:mRNA interferase MazF
MKRSEIWLVNLDLIIGSEIQKTRPAIIVSPDELNAYLNTVIIVPLTTGRSYPFRVPTKVQGKDGLAAIDQVRTVDKRRLVKRLGMIRKDSFEAVQFALVEMFTK